MIDIDLLRRTPDLVRQAVSNKAEKHADVNKACEIDAAWRKCRTETETLQKSKNDLDARIGLLMREKKAAEAESVKAESRALGEKIKAAEAEAKRLDEERRAALEWIPNLPHESVPVAADAAGNVEVRHWGERRTFPFTPLAHWDVGEKLGILDIPRGSKIAGSGFPLFVGAGSRLCRALVNWMMDVHVQEHGYVELNVPVIANRPTMYATGQLPKLEQEMYFVERDGLFLIPTAEVPVTNIYRDEILPGDTLPRYHTAYSVCFRREAGAAGKDTRGIIRVHQFEKVEMVKFVRPEGSFDELERLVGNAETLLQRLGLEYRVLLLSTGDMSFASAKTYDLEVWAPGVGRYLEASSCSNFTDFQARRGNIRFRDKEGKVRLVHTLNGSGLALPRVIVALLETYQNADGSVTLPEVLRPYLGGEATIRPIK
ncbi:MAG: serine--tRNA ligase [Planctomycetes bacterium]|nr:serine--tRNA ligase [Planctomycetota bacterium]